MGRATDKGDEFAASHGAPKAKDHDLIITPRIAARSGHSCPLRVNYDRAILHPLPPHVRLAPKADNRAELSPSPLCAIRDRTQRSKIHGYSIPSSACDRNGSRIVSPSRPAPRRVSR
jgi:hypothetical protein